MNTIRVWENPCHSLPRWLKKQNMMTLNEELDFLANKFKEEVFGNTEEEYDRFNGDAFLAFMYANGETPIGLYGTNVYEEARYILGEVQRISYLIYLDKVVRYTGLVDPINHGKILRAAKEVEDEGALLREIHHSLMSLGRKVVWFSGMSKKHSYKNKSFLYGYVDKTSIEDVYNLYKDIMEELPSSIIRK